MKKLLLTIPLVITAVVLVVGISISVIYTDDEGEASTPILDPNYDDRWVSNFPQTIGGFNVGHISTPKHRACSSVPMIRLQTPKPSLDEFLSHPPDMNSLKADIHSVLGVPSTVNISFSPRLVDKTTGASRDESWSNERLQKGCLPELADIEQGNSGTPNRGFAIFQNKDAGSYTDDNAQGVKIRTPSGIGTGQNDWSAALNNVITNNGYFMQSGMLLKVGDTSIIWTEDHLGLIAQPYDDVPYLASNLYQFSISYTSGSWQMCAGNDEDISQYQCITSSHATGTHLAEDVATSVFFENANDNDTWNSGFPATVAVSDAKIFRDGTAQNWSTEDRVSLHRCGGNQYPVAGAMNSTLKNNGSATWKMSGTPLACP